MTSEPAPPTGRRERHKAATRQALTEAALSLFEERGYSATTVADITERVDVAERTFFRYFPTKEAVLFPDFEDGKAPFIAALASRPPDESLMDAVIAAFVDGVDLAVENRELAARRTAILDQDEISRDALTWNNLANSHRFIEEALADHSGLAVTDERIRLAAGASLLVVSQAYDEWTGDGDRPDLAQLIEHKHAALRSILAES